MEKACSELGLKAFLKYGFILCYFMETSKHDVNRCQLALYVYLG